MRNILAFAAAGLLTLGAPAFAQSTSKDPSAQPGMSRDGAGMSEGRAATRDDSTGAANAARRGTETNGNTNGNNQTRNNGS